MNKLIIILFSLFLSTNLFAEIKVPGSGGINYWDDFEKYYKKQLKKSEKKKQNLIYYGSTSGGGWAPGFIIVKEVNDEINALKEDYEIAVSARKRTTVGASEMQISEFTNYISEFVRGNIPPSPRKGIGPIPQLKLVVEDLQAFYTETIRC